MTARTEQAAELLRDELHARTLQTDPTQAYATAPELRDILTRVDQMLDHLSSAAHAATGHDNPGTDLSDSQSNVAGGVLLARAHLHDACHYLNRIHTELGHLIWADEPAGGAS